MFSIPGASSFSGRFLFVKDTPALHHGALSPRTQPLDGVVAVVSLTFAIHVLDIIVTLAIRDLDIIVFGPICQRVCLFLKIRDYTRWGASAHRAGYPR